MLGSRVLRLVGMRQQQQQLRGLLTGGLATHLVRICFSDMI
jgi:hypothetical protein